MWMLNGNAASQIPINDRGLMLGDGFFTTIQVREGHLQLWPEHWSRIEECCQRLRLPLPHEEGLLTRLHGMASDQSRACIKLVLTRGSGGRGYSPLGCDQPNEMVGVFPFPLHYLTWRQQGVALGICKQRLGSSPMLAGLKTLNRLEQVLLKAELDESGLDEAVVLNTAGQVIEAVTANLFWRRDCVLYTPDLSLMGVRGVMRAWVLKQVARLGYDHAVVQAPLSSLLQADEVFMTNALMEVVPVTGIDDVEYPDHAFARQLQSLLAAPSHS